MTEEIDFNRKDDESMYSATIQNGIESEIAASLNVLRNPHEDIDMFSNIKAEDRLYFAKVNAKSIFLPSYNPSFNKGFLRLGRSQDGFGSKQLENICKNYGGGGEINTALTDRVRSMLGIKDM